MKGYFDLDGDGGSNVVEQVLQRRRRVVENLSHLRHVVAIGSGKGGVGKSTLTMLLAMELCRRSRTTAILDADFNGPSQSHLGGLRVSPPQVGSRGLVVPRTQSGVGVLSFGTLVAEPKAVDFASVAQGDSFTWRSTKEFSILADLLGRVDWSQYEVLLLDLPPGTERTFQYGEFLGSCASFLLVSLPSSLATGVVSRSLFALRKIEAVLLGYVENMDGYYCRCCGEVRPLFPRSSQVSGLDLPCLGSLPFDPRLSGPDLSQLAPTEPLREAVEKICDNLWAALEGANT